jgi:hypothetical protein
MAEVLIARGDLDEARATIADGLALIGETGARAEEPVLHERLADIARLGGDGASHERELREAARLYGAIGATGNAERVLALLGELSATA